MDKQFIHLFGLPSLLQEQKAQALKRLRLQGAKRLGVHNPVDIFSKSRKNSDFFQRLEVSKNRKNSDF